MPSEGCGWRFTGISVFVGAVFVKHFGGCSGRHSESSKTPCTVSAEHTRS